jgi:hypothetical protein
MIPRREPQRVVAASHAAARWPYRARSAAPRSSPPVDDLAISALQRYVDATDVRPADGLAMRVRLRIAAEPATPPPSRLRSALGMFGVRPARRPSAWTPAAGSGRLPTSGLVRFKALGMALATVLVVGGGAAAGLAGVQILASAVTGERPKHHDRPSLIRGPVTPSSEPSRWPSAIPVYPFGVGPASAPDVGAAEPTEQVETVEPDDELDVSGPPEAPGRSERGEDRRGGNGHGRAGGVGGGRPTDLPKSPKGQPNGPKGEPNGPKGEPNGPKGGNGNNGANEPRGEPN